MRRVHSVRVRAVVFGERSVRKNAGVLVMGTGARAKIEIHVEANAVRKRRGNGPRHVRHSSLHTAIRLNMLRNFFEFFPRPARVHAAAVVTFPSHMHAIRATCTDAFGRYPNAHAFHDTFIVFAVRTFRFVVVLLFLFALTT